MNDDAKSRDVDCQTERTCKLPVVEGLCSPNTETEGVIMFNKNEFEETEDNRCCDWHFHELILQFKREGVSPGELKNMPLATYRSKSEVGKIGDTSLVCGGDSLPRRLNICEDCYSEVPDHKLVSRMLK